MTGKELILSVLEHKKAPRPAWIPYTGVQIGNLIGVNAEEVYQDGDKLYTALMEANKQYSPDGLPVIFDLQVEAEVMGCNLLWAKDSPPTVSSHPLADTTDLPKVPDLSTSGRVPMIVDVMKRLTKEIGDKVALYGLVCGPFTLASHLRSTNIFMDMYDNPDYVVSLVNYCNDIAVDLSMIYKEAGMSVLAAVDPLISQISPEMFEQFMSAPYTRYFEEVKKSGAKSSFFVCGDATKNIEVMLKTDPDCISVDENISMEEAKKLTDKYNKVLSGNIALTTVMLLGNQKDNQKAALELVDQMGDTNYILAPGCDMPFATPVENVVGIGQTVQNVEGVRAVLANYVKESVDIDIELPDYGSLDHVLIEVLTIDSSSCAACGYMKAAADDMKEIFGDKVKIVEHKITEPENIARISKMGVANLPAMAINGDVKHISLIPSRKVLEVQVKALV